MNAIFKNESPSPVMVQILQAGGILSVVLRLKLLIFTIIKLVEAIDLYDYKTGCLETTTTYPYINCACSDAIFVA